jgi:uncharacterized protein GlcG (DUF336 family)
VLRINRLDLNDAHLLIEGAKKKAGEIGVPMCIAIVDESGGLIAFDRMNGGKISSVAIAQDKAFTAAAACKATHEYNPSSFSESQTVNIHKAAGTRVSVVGVGLPVNVEGDVVGGIGISSGTPVQDMECAEAGIEYFMLWRTGPKLENGYAYTELLQK